LKLLVVEYRSVFFFFLGAIGCIQRQRSYLEVYSASNCMFYEISQEKQKNLGTSYFRKLETFRFQFPSQTDELSAYFQEVYIGSWGMIVIIIAGRSGDRRCTWRTHTTSKATGEFWQRNLKKWWRSTNRVCMGTSDGRLSPILLVVNFVKEPLIRSTHLSFASRKWSEPSTSQTTKYSASMASSTQLCEQIQFGPSLDKQQHPSLWVPTYLLLLHQPLQAFGTLVGVLRTRSNGFSWELPGFIYI
jgi:hypothetical protein